MTAKKSKRAWTARTLEEVAGFFGIGYGTVRDWKKGGMPGGEGRYDLSAIFAWFREREERRRAGEKGKEQESVYDRYKGLRMRLLYLKDKGALIRRDDHENLVLALIAAFTRKLEELAIALPERVREVPPLELPRFFREHFDAALLDLAQNGGRTRKKAKKRK